MKITHFLGVFFVNTAFIVSNVLASKIFQEEVIPQGLSITHFKQSEVVGTYLFPEEGAFEAILKAVKSKKKSFLKMFKNTYRVDFVGGNEEFHQKFSKCQLRLSFFKKTEDEQGLKPTYCVFVYQDEQTWKTVARFAAILKRSQKLKKKRKNKAF